MEKYIYYANGASTILSVATLGRRECVSKKLRVDQTRKPKSFFIHEVVKDTSKQYRRLKIRQVEDRR